MLFSIRSYRRFPAKCFILYSTSRWAIFFFAVWLTGCGHFFAKDRLISALESGQIKQGVPVEEIRKLAGEPNSSREINLADIPLTVWEYRQTGVDDSDRYTRLVIATYGIGGLFPVKATEKHFIFFSQNRVVAWDSTPTVTGGTAFAVSDHYLLTNLHVVKGADFLRVRLDKESVPVVLSLADQEKDIAVLEIAQARMDTPSNVRTNYKLSGWLDLGEDVSMRQGDSVWTLGYPLTEDLGRSSVLMQGLISSLTGIDGNPHEFLISVPLQPGNSGGPLFNQRAEVIGITTSVLNPTKLYAEQKALPQNMNFAVKIGEVKALLRKGGVALPEPQPQRSINPVFQLASLVEAVSPYVAEITGIRFEPIKYKVRPKQADPAESY